MRGYKANLMDVSDAQESIQYTHYPEDIDDKARCIYTIICYCKLCNTTFSYFCEHNIQGDINYYYTPRENLKDLSIICKSEEIKMRNSSCNPKNENNIVKLINTPIISRIENSIANYCINKIKTSLCVSIRLNFDHTNYRKFLCWLKKYDPLFSKHITKIPYVPYYILKDADFFIKVGDYTFARILTGCSIKNTLDDFERRNTTSVLDTWVHVYIFGKDAKKVAYKLNKIGMFDQNTIVNYTISASNRNRDGVDIYRDLSSCRHKDSVFLNDNIKETILNHTKKFFENKHIYAQRNLTYKTGILLYGEPGTGKSTIANMIATEHKCNMVIIKMAQFSEIDTDFIASTINADDLTYIVLLEDIDCVIGDRESETEDLENKKNVNKLLQFLDSASSPSNVIFVATTNHIEKLDEAILRDGRFDLKVNITNINEKAAIQMCKSFGIKDDTIIKRLFNENNIEGRINPAKLQNLILKELK